MRHVGRHMRIHENQPVIAGSRLAQLGHQLPDKDGIRAASEPGQSVIIPAQRFLRQVSTQTVDDVEADPVVLPFQVSVADDEIANHGFQLIRLRAICRKMVPSVPTTTTCSGIRPMAWVEHDKQGS